MDEIAIFLCDYTGNAARPWAEAGYQCYCVDIQHSIRRDRVEGNIHYVWGDCRSWRPPEGKRIVFVGAFPFCTNDAVSGARDFVKKGGMMLRDSLECFESCRMAAAWSGAPYYVEHPVTMLSSMPHIGKPQHYFDPCDYTFHEPEDNYTKKTCLWAGNGFVMPEPKRLEGLPPPDDRIHKCPPSDNRANIRSETPMGFTRAVFEANRPDRLLLRAA